ncbi:MAG: hypothetical protein AB1507_04400 [Bacillota bacterium]
MVTGFGNTKTLLTLLRRPLAGARRTAVQLADLAAVFHPDAFAGHKLRCFLKLPRE